MNDPSTLPLFTPRLILRRLEAEDASALCDYRALPEVARFQSWTSYHLGDARQLIAEQTGHEPAIPGTWFQLGIVESASHRLIGDCGLHCPRGNPDEMEIGITLSPAHQRCGYASETVERLLQYLFALGKNRVIAITDAGNDAAIRLFQRLGFRQESRQQLWFKGQWGCEFTFAMDRREWIT
jgi:RimJ/RimL family protein N-acetyltransferase